MTFAKFGSSRLKTIVVIARRIVLATRRTSSEAKFGSPGRDVAGAVDDRPVGREQDGERVRLGQRPQGRVLLEDVQPVEDGEAVQPGRQEPAQPQDVALDVAEVAEEDVAGRHQVGAAQGEHELDRGDDRDEHAGTARSGAGRTASATPARWSRTRS